MRALGILAMVFEVDRLVQNIYQFFSVQQNRILKTRKEPKAIHFVASITPDVDNSQKDCFEVKVKNPNKDKGPENELETVFSDDKYTENFEEIEDHIKNLEDKCIDSFEAIEKMYVDKFEAIENKIKSQDSKLDQIIRFMEKDKLGGDEE